MKNKKTAQSKNLPAQITPARLKVIKTENGVTKIQENETGKFLTTGFSSDGCKTFLEISMSAAINLNDNGNDPEVFQKLGDGFLAMMAEFEPQDPFEGMLLSQMVMIFKQAMHFFQLSNQKSNQTIAIGDTLMNRYVKLMRLYTQQLETLDKHRNKGRQTMTVEHVHVHKGGQAIVGNMSTGEGGGRS